MSDDDLSSFFSSATVKPALPFVEPPPLDQVLEALDELELENADVGIQFPTLLDIFSPTCPNASARSLALSSESAYSTPGLTEDIYNTEYSFTSVSTSNYYPSLSDRALRYIAFDSGDNYVGPTHNPVISDSSMFHDTSESGISQLSFQHNPVVNALPDDGLYRQPVGISPHYISATFQSPPPAVPIDPPADVASTARVFTGPIRTKPKPACDQCGRVFDRRSNLKSHMKTHDPNRERPFVCPESDCGYRFTRSNDRKRHLENMNIHGVRAE